MSLTEFRELHSFLTSCQAAFARLAGDGDWVSRQVLQAQLEAEGHGLEPPAVATLLAVFDPDR